MACLSLRQNLYTIASELGRSNGLLLSVTLLFEQVAGWEQQTLVLACPVVWNHCPRSEMEGRPLGPHYSLLNLGSASDPQVTPG